MQYNAEQLEFIRYPLTNLLLLAPPGSGKTQVAGERIYKMSQAGVDMKKMLATTFNVDAAKELNDRLVQYGLPVLPIIRNYHKVASRMNRSFIKNGFLPGAELITQEWIIRGKAIEALKQVIGHASSRDTINVNDPSVIDDFVGFIGFAKSDIQNAETMFKRLGLLPIYTPFIAAFTVFEENRKQSRFQTFDDLIYDPAIVLETNPAAKALVSNHLEHILVDEFQDINPIMYRLLRHLAGDTAKFICIGDDDQTINVYRGSDPTFMISGFLNHQKNATSLALLQTYRYGHAVALCANALVNNNTTRAPKLCVSEPNAPISKVTVGYYEKSDPVPYRCPEQHSLIKIIRHHHARGGPLNDIGILLRTYHLAPWIESALIRENIPYKMTDAKSAKSNPVVKGIIAFASAIGMSSLTGDITKSLTTLLNYPFLSIRQDQLVQLGPFIRQGRGVVSSSLKSALPGVQDFVIERIRKRIETLNTSLALPYIAALNHYFDHYIVSEFNLVIDKRKSDTDRKNLALVNSFIHTAKNFPHAQAFLDSIQLANSGHSEAVCITSMHSAKGCAWPTVIIPGCVETMLPYEHPNKTTSIEDERRLMYVGITRPRRHLHLITNSIPGFNRELKASTGIPPSPVTVSPQQPSRFLYEMQINDCISVADAIHDQSKATTETHGERALFDQYLTAFYQMTNQ